MTQEDQQSTPRGSKRGGRRRGPGGRQSDPAENHRDDAQFPGRRSQRGGRARGGRDRQSRRGPADGAVSKEGEQGQTPGDTTETAKVEKGKQVATPATDAPDDGDVCFICASKVEHIAVAPCNHRTCHICMLRLRALYKTKTCAHCRTESDFVIFTDDPVKRFEEFTDSEIAQTDENLGIKYEKNEIFEDTVILLRYNCPDKNCDVACLGWPDLHRHVKSKHGKVMCDLCTRNKKVFTHEHELFTHAQLRRHEKYGDDQPGSLEQSGFKGHPECGFCRQRFYGDDELYAHCRDRHERCHICDRRSDGRQQQYFIDYDALEDHFRRDHFLCMDKECLEKKFVVFETQMDLQAHQLEAHPHGMSKDARRDARTVDLSTFDYRAPYQPQSSRRGAGRGRDPNAEPLPISSAQPLRRDELAFQRQMAIQSAQSVSTRTFGGQLTPRDPQPTQSPARPTAAQTAASSRSPPTTAMEQLNLADVDPTTLSPQDQARRLRHAAVIERASNLLQHDARKMNEFRTKVSNYRTSKITATDLIDAFFSLFDAPSSELGKLIKELADIYEDETKRSNLLKAWNDWRAINEDYPALPGPSTGAALSSNTTPNIGSGKRVLRLKSSTAQSSRSAVGRTGTMPSAAFPPLSSASSSAASRATAPAWATARSSPSAASWGATTSQPSRSPGPRTTDTEDFPALPAAPKPNTLMAGLTRGTVRWDDRRGHPSTNPWTGANSSSSASREVNGGDDGPPPSGTSTPVGKGKGKRGKQVLIQFG
ncbi:hypothetical protein VTN31DRAFT_3857 [Thermomyces dupontii]|uniref:uncharacterized protein n=1 Tax=Talaromyces thermophilus TaxID=28565 RepID=UPI0037426115